MPNTYTELYRTNLSGLSSASFTSIPQGYTDLVLVFSGQDSATSSSGFSMGINNTFSGGLYSSTVLEGNGSTAYSNRSTSQNGIGITVSGGTNLPGNAIINFQNYSNTTTFKTVLTRYNAPGAVVGAKVDLFRSTSAITRLDFFPYTANWATGTTISLYGIANADLGSAKATGGIITEDATYWYHTFAASGTFTPKVALSCDYLVVAGGGGGGPSYGGGGGAGGFREGLALSAASGTPIAVTVGAGGVGGNTPANGSNSVFSSITSTGGGKAGVGNPQSLGDGPGNGGSGGGNGGWVPSTNGVTTPVGTASPSGQGNNGGATGGTGNKISGGGGGAGAVGGNGNGGTQVSGSGGVGLSSSMSGTSVTYAGGGGGGAGYNGAEGTAGTGGAGGGGNGSNTTVGSAGTANTGGGGGGGDLFDQGGAGGSGIVIVRYAK